MELVGNMVILFLFFLKILHIVFHSGCTNFHYHWQCKSIPFSLRLCQCLLFVDFLMTAIQTGGRWYIIMVLICISLMISSVKHLFTYLLAIICLLWRNVCLGLLPIFWLGCLFFCYCIVWAICMFWKLTTGGYLNFN